MQEKLSDSLKSGQRCNNCRSGVECESQGALTEEMSSYGAGRCACAAEVLLVKV